MIIKQNTEKIIQEAVNLAQSYIGTKEDPKGSNRGVGIDAIQKTFGFKGVQYCALFAQYVYKAITLIYHIPFLMPGTASSQTLYGWAKNNGYACNDFSQIAVGDIVIWRKFKLWQGHVGIVVSVNHEQNYFETVEGNTANSDFGDQRDGDGIYRRKRYMRKQDFVVDAFYLRGFIQMRKVYA